MRKCDSKPLEYIAMRVTPDARNGNGNYTSRTRDLRKKPVRSLYLHAPLYCHVPRAFFVRSVTRSGGRRLSRGLQEKSGRDGSRYAIHYGEWIQRSPSKAFHLVVSFSLPRSLSLSLSPPFSPAIALASNTDTLRTRQGRKFSRYTQCLSLHCLPRVYSVLFIISARLYHGCTHDAHHALKRVYDKTVSGIQWGDLHLVLDMGGIFISRERGQAKWEASKNRKKS